MTCDKPHPVQPVYVDKYGNDRFKENAIVKFLLTTCEQHGVDLNTLASMAFTAEDRMQLAMLIGYSVAALGR